MRGERCGKQGHEQQIMKLLSAALLYFVIVFGVGFVFGPIRVIWLESRLGKPVAVIAFAAMPALANRRRSSS